MVFYPIGSELNSPFEQIWNDTIALIQFNATSS